MPPQLYLLYNPLLSINIIRLSFISFMKGIIFDMDGVLVDAMPYHCKALQMAIKQQTNIEIDDRTIFLLEGCQPMK